MRYLCALILLCAVMACNTGDLVSAPVAPGPSPTPIATTLPTPTGSPTLPHPIGDHDCGNADYGPAWEAYDPDDGAGPADNYLCYWLCADNSSGVFSPADPAPPHEVIVEFDWDVPYPAYQESPATYLPCNSAHP